MRFFNLKLIQLIFYVAILGSVSSQFDMSDAQFGSTWSAWSAWSFCSNGVMIRVRACSTVRGFKCIGHNKEFQSCDDRKQNQAKELDPEEADRSEAMKQLYDDYEPDTNAIAKTTRKPKPAIILPIPPPKQVLPPLSAFPTSNSVNSVNSLPSFPPAHPKMVLPPGAPAWKGSRPNPQSSTIQVTTTTTQPVAPSTIKIEPKLQKPRAEGEMTLEALIESNKKLGVPLDESSLFLPEKLSPQLIAQLMAEPDSEEDSEYDDEMEMEHGDIADSNKYRQVLPTPETDEIRKMVASSTMATNPNFFKIIETDAEEEEERIKKLPNPTSTVTFAPSPATLPTKSTTPISIPTPSTMKLIELINLTTPASPLSKTTVAPALVTATIKPIEPVIVNQPKQQEVVAALDEFAMSDSEFERRYTTKDDSDMEDGDKSESRGQDFGDEIQKVDFDNAFGIVLPQKPSASSVATPHVTLPKQNNNAPVRLFKIMQPAAPITAPRIAFGFSVKPKKVLEAIDSSPKTVVKDEAKRLLPENQEPTEVVLPTTTLKPRHRPNKKKTKFGKKKPRKQHRLRMLNSKIKTSDIALLPTALAFKHTESEARKVFPLTTVATISEKKVNRTLEKIDKLIEEIEINGAGYNTPIVNKTHQIYEETLDIERRLEQLQKAVEKSKQKIATQAPLPNVDVLEGDTARALSWMIANMSKLVENDSDLPVVDMIPLERVVDTPAFKVRMTTRGESISAPMTENPEIIRKRRRQLKLRRSPNKLIYTDWTDWSVCNCGVSIRKRYCKNLATKHVHNAEDDFARIRGRRSHNCETQEETRKCNSVKCDADTS